MGSVWGSVQTVTTEKLGFHTAVSVLCDVTSDVGYPDICGSCSKNGGEVLVRNLVVLGIFFFALKIRFITYSEVQ